ncbi:peroxisomal biogenesis factor 11 [Chytriomyces cf. hyalinus JEL632]|nr:peroxisomal biogenesis factor 11 [Chytriomyces cf. hyalinus JEL632]
MSQITTTDKTVKFLATTVGRDRINRFVQYFLRFAVHQVQDKDTAKRISSLVAVLGQTRKVMRTGRQIEFLRAIYKFLEIRDDVVKSTSIAKAVFLSLWLCFDTCQWIHTANIYKFNDIKDIGVKAFKCWLLALVFSFTGDLYKLQMNGRKLAIEKKVAASGNKDEGRSLLIERGKLRLATLQDGVDILLPAAGLEYVPLSPAYVGLAGAFTSLLGGYTHWNSL